MQELLNEGISIRRGIMCAPRERAYAIEPGRCTDPGHVHKEAAESACGAPRESEPAQDHSIALPLFHAMSERDQVRVVHALARALGRLGGAGGQQ